jgi:hypothetical protein
MKAMPPNRAGSVLLACMPSVDMWGKHPQRIERACEWCGKMLGIYPPGQQFLREHPCAQIVCHLCLRSMLESECVGRTGAPVAKGKEKGAA